jgi:Rps23 Pro-64 3,4-dihydroxylase Tpa1-like proline 4-hydroxylase
MPSALAPRLAAPPSGILDLDGFAAFARRARDGFLSASPFPHVVIDGFLHEAVADALAAEFAADTIDWQSLHHVNERKLVFGDRQHMGPIAAAVIDELHSPAFVRTLEDLTGLGDLFGDPDLDGAGLHRMLPGGHLNVHADALSHAKRRTWSRQLNLILFLNRGWDESYRGWLEFWDADVAQCVRRITPGFNRAVLFRTIETSFHGVPEGVHCPADQTRRSLALYYFREERHTVPLRTTRYVARPGDPALRRALIRFDRMLVAAYSLLKRYTPLDNARVSRFLRRI